MSYRVTFQTFGCKLNQLETEALADSFARAGAAVLPQGSEAELHVLNTCTVTGKAEQKARRSIRAALAAGPRSPGREAVVVVTGCYAQVEAEAIEGLGERVVAVRGEDKALLHGLAAWLADEWQGHGDLLEAVRDWRAAAAARAGVLAAGGATDEADGAGVAASGAGARPGNAARDGRFAFSPAAFAFHSRPSLKIQDGCNNRCSYCRVCIARGPSVSLEPAIVLERLRALEDSGAAEAVLTGVNLSQYRSGGLGFAGLLGYLLAGTSRIAIRLSSFEPDRVDAAFLEAFGERRVRPHLHLPIQSGSDAVLARMGRRYTASEILAACEALRKVKGDPFLAADLIAGFPGETDTDFEATLSTAAAAGLAWIHAFPFSARPGTAAWDLRPRVPERIAGERVAALTALAEVGREAYLARWMGREVEAVLETSYDGAVGDAGGAGNAGAAGDTEDAGAGGNARGDAGAAGGARAGSGLSGDPASGRPSFRATSDNYLRLALDALPPGQGGNGRRGNAFLCQITGREGPGREAGARDPGVDASARALSWLRPGA
jgi:threonylcarbamoyladenosine tRNA methylthiotransferase MtaB